MITIYDNQKAGNEAWQDIVAVVADPSRPFCVAKPFKSFLLNLAAHTHKAASKKKRWNSRRVIFVTAMLGSKRRKHFRLHTWMSPHLV